MASKKKAAKKSPAKKKSTIKKVSRAKAPAKKAPKKKAPKKVPSHVSGADVDLTKVVEWKEKNPKVFTSEKWDELTHIAMKAAGIAVIYFPRMPRPSVIGGSVTSTKLLNALALMRDMVSSRDMPSNPDMVKVTGFILRPGDTIGSPGNVLAPNATVTLPDGSEHTIRENKPVVVTAEVPAVPVAENGFSVGGTGNT